MGRADDRHRTSPAWAPGLVVDDYQLEDRLGAGAMGEVWLARHLPTGARHALKTLLEGGPELLQRFQREAEALGRVGRHPNVASVHACGRAGGRSYLSMDYASGGDLQTRLRDGPLPARQAAEWVRDLARGLAHVHTHGVLHRDLKPANVLFDERGTPKLADFGLARVSGADRLTQTGEVLGTPSYMAPEQVGNRDEVGPATDVYGLGAILYHCLTGQPPFRGGSVWEVLNKVGRERPRPLRERQPDVPQELEALCLRALAKSPRDRGDVSDLEQGLDAWLSGESSPPRRRPWLMAGAALAVLVVLSAAWALALSGARAAGPPAQPTAVDSPQASATDSPQPTETGPDGAQRPYQGATLEGRALRSAHFLDNGTLLILSRESASCWDPISNSRRELTIPTPSFAAAAVDGHGTSFAVVNEDGAAAVYGSGDTTPRAQHAFELNGRELVLSAALSYDGRWLAAGTSTRAHVLDLQTDAVTALAGPPVDEPEAENRYLAFAPWKGGGLLVGAAAHTDGGDWLRWWSCVEGNWEPVSHAVVGTEPSSLAFAPAGNAVLVGDRSGVAMVLRLPDLEHTGQLESPLTKHKAWLSRYAHERGVAGLAWRGDELYSAGGGRSTRPGRSRFVRWSWSYEFRETLLELEPDSPLTYRPGIALDPRGEHVALIEQSVAPRGHEDASKEGRVRVLRLPARRTARRWVHAGALDAAFVGERALSLSRRDLRLWAPGQDEPVAKLELPGFQRLASASASEVLILAGDGRLARIVVTGDTLSDPILVREALFEQKNYVGGALASSPDGRWFATGDGDGGARVVTRDGREAQVLPGAGPDPSHRVHALSFAAQEGRLLLAAAAGRNGTPLRGWVSLWEHTPDGWTALARVEEPASALTLHSRGAWLLTGTGTGHVHRRAVPDLKRLWPYPGELSDVGARALGVAHSKVVGHVAVRDDGVAFTATSANDPPNDVARWGARGGEIMRGSPQAGRYLALKLSPDGRWLLTIRDDEVVLAPADDPADW